MELRSGSLIPSGTGFTSAEQARAACLGQARVQLSAAQRPLFDAAVRGVLLRWTALRLAVENGWGGEEGDAKAAELEQSICGWFAAKGDHYADELEDHLAEFLDDEFAVEAEDGSPAEARRLALLARPALTRPRWPRCWCTCSRPWRAATRRWRSSWRRRRRR